MTHPARRLASALIISLALTAIFLSGCSLLKPPPPAAPLAELRPTLRPGFSVAPDRLAAMPRYSITVQIDPANNAYTGTLEAVIPITGTTPWNDLYFRLYPNLSQFGGTLDVRGIAVDGLAVNYGYQASRTALHLSLPKALPVGHRAHIWMGFTGKTLNRPAGTYTIFGSNDGVLSLTNFYPILAGRRGAEWALDIASPLGDVGFHEAALYRVEATFPAGEIVAATGISTTETIENGWITRSYLHGPAREFTLMMSPRYKTLDQVAYGVRVRSYFLPGHEEAGRAALRYGVAAMQVYSDQFGPYPYREMSIVEAPLTFRGMEFPGMSLIGTQDYDKFRQDLENLVVHEVAHHWWYNLVGSDQPGAPWLDEGLAEWSMYAYYLARYGFYHAEQVRAERWQIPVRAAVQSGADRPIGLPVKAYGRDDYERTIYAKGALFFATLRDEIGEEAFNKALRRYLQRHEWRIATEADFLTIVNEVSGRDLGAMFARWVDGKTQ